MPELLRAALAGVMAFLLTLAGVWLLGPLAARLGMVDHPTERKNHAGPTPITGGVAMLVGILLPMVVLLGDFGPAARGFCVASIILTVLGIVDDRIDLSWRVRIGVQVVAALALIFIGGIRIEQLGDAFGLGVQQLGLFSVPFTVFATVGAINAVNMIDGADGLAGMLVLCALVMLEAAALYAGNAAVFLRAPILIGAVAAFLLYNLRFPGRARAHIFMGNAGSAFLGLVVATFAFRLTQNPQHPVTPVLALWLIPVPIIDCLVLIVRRLRRKRSPFIADRNHVHHLMLEAGFGPMRATLVLAGFSCTTGLLAALLLRAHIPHVILLVAFVGLCVLWYGVTARHARAVALFRVLGGMPSQRGATTVLAADQPDK